jgi:uncharacterized protein (TIGR03086 family)
MDAVTALDVATAGFADALSRVVPDHWAAPTPNPGWSVHDLVNHVVGGNRRYVLLLAGAPTDVVESLRDVDHLSEDWSRDFALTSREVAAAFREPGVLERTVHHRMGDRSGRQLLTMRITEHALHGWDLAKAIGIGYQIHDGVAAVLLDEMASDPLIAGGFTPLAGASELVGSEKLLALTGRR